jgi:hypothetical protein
MFPESILGYTNTPTRIGTTHIPALSNPRTSS